MKRIGWIAAVLAVGLLLNAQPPAATYKVPYRLGPTRHFLVRAKIDGKGPFNLVIDTGAPMLVLAKKLRPQLGLAENDSSWETLKKFEIEGGVVFEDQTARFDDLFQLEGMNGLGLAGLEIHGLAGYPILARYRIEYDLNQPTMVWTKLDHVPDEMARRAGKSVAPGGLNAIGSAMKGIGGLLGMNKPPELKYRPFLGLNLAERDGKLVVESIVNESPAATLQVGDVVLGVGDQSVATKARFIEAVDRVKGPVTVKVARAGQEWTIELQARGGF